MRTGPWLPGPEPARVDRPALSGSGIDRSRAGSDGGALLDWSWAAARLERSHNYWVATASPDGVPQLTAVRGVWIGGALYFSTGCEAVETRNLTVSAHCVVTPEYADEAVVVHGVAERVGDPPAVDYVRRAYIAKYGSAFPDPADDPLFAVVPRVVLGFTSDKADSANTVTRWNFASIDD